MRTLSQFSFVRTLSLAREKTSNSLFCSTTELEIYLLSYCISRFVQSSTQKEIYRKFFVYVLVLRKSLISTVYYGGYVKRVTFKVP